MDDFDDEPDDIVESDGDMIVSDISSDDGFLGDRVGRVSLNNNDESSEDERDEQNVLMAINSIMSIIANSVSLVMK